MQNCVLVGKNGLQQARQKCERFENNKEKSHEKGLNFSQFTNGR